MQAKKVATLNMGTGKEQREDRQGNFALVHGSIPCSLFKQPGIKPTLRRPYSLLRPRAGPFTLVPRKSPRGMERRVAQPSVRRLAASRALRRHVRHPTLHRRLFCPRRRTSVGRNAGQSGPATRAASGARRRPIVQPSKAAGPSAGGRSREGFPGHRVANPAGRKGCPSAGVRLPGQPQAPHPAPHQNASRSAPLSSEDAGSVSRGMIVCLGIYSGLCYPRLQERG